MKLTNKICIVTGGARGNGAAIAESLLTRGCKVLIGDVLTKEGKATEERFAKKFGTKKVCFFNVDVSSHHNFNLAFEKCHQTFGRYPDILVNNAGILGEENWERVLDINLKGCLLGTNLAMSYMSKEAGGRGGHVVCVSSAIGLFLNGPVFPTYVATKCGIIGYVRSIGHPKEFAESGVNVVCLCPHFVDTPMLGTISETAMTTGGAKHMAEVMTKNTDRKLLKPDDVGEAVCKLVCEAESGTVWGLDLTGEDPFEVRERMSWDEVVKEFKKT